MIRSFVSERRSRGQRASGYSTPAPVGGWNARDSVANMAESDATRLDNWFPEEGQVRIRRGYEKYTDETVYWVTEDGDNVVTGDGYDAVVSTGLDQSVNFESVMAWSAPADSALFAAGGGKIYDVTGGGEVSGIPVVTGLNLDRWQHVMFGTAGGHYLYIVNGSDAPRYYDGSSWTVPTITGSGLTAANLIHINLFKNRLFFVEKGTLSFWYFPVNTISGSITEFDLAPLCTLGGYLMAMGTWTIDAGTGVDDYAVFITSKGEVFVYRGSDPGDANDWSLVGSFRIGAPIGRRCLMKLGSDLLTLTEDGISPLSLALAGARLSERAAHSEKISGAYHTAVRDHKTKFGWQPILYPQGNMAVVNIPIVEGSQAVQFVANTTTKAWCRFTGINAFCWELYNEELYFGGTGYVGKADTGLDDDGSDINADARTAFTYFRRRGMLKNFQMARPILSADGDVQVAMAANMDFEELAPTTTPTFQEAVGAVWDEAIWDDAAWGSVPAISKDWQSVVGVGYAVALRIQAVARGGSIAWQSTDWIWEPGGLI